MPDDGKKPATSGAVGSADVSHYPVKILIALHEVMSKVGYVQKQGKNKFHDYKYAGEGHLLEVLRPAMVEAGLLLIPSHRSTTTPDEYGNSTVTVDYTLAHKDGGVWPEKITVVGCGNDKNSKGGVGDKGLYKAFTGANKYLLFKLFQIETGDDPEEAAEHDKGDASPKPESPAPTKNAPGVSEARVWARDHLKDLNACESADEFLTHLATMAIRWVKICGVYPNLYVGPDGSGLKGEAQKLATIFECRQEFDKFIKQVEAQAETIQQPKEAAQ